MLLLDGQTVGQNKSIEHAAQVTDYWTRDVTSDVTTRSKKRTNINSLMQNVPTNVCQEDENLEFLFHEA